MLDFLKNRKDGGKYYLHSKLMHCQALSGYSSELGLLLAVVTFRAHVFRLF